MSTKTRFEKEAKGNSEMVYSPGRMKLSKRRRWKRIFRSFRWKREKSNTSEGIPFFFETFQWKSTFYLIYHGNNRFFRTKGKRPKCYTTALLSANQNQVFSSCMLIRKKSSCCVGGRSMSESWVYHVRRWKFEFYHRRKFERHELMSFELFMVVKFKLSTPQFINTIL